MAKAITVNDSGMVAPSEAAGTANQQTAREAAWEKFKANFQEKRPVQYAEYDAEGYWNQIPENFKF